MVREAGLIDMEVVMMRYNRKVWRIAATIFILMYLIGCGNHPAGYAEETAAERGKEKDTIMSEGRTEDYKAAKDVNKMIADAIGCDEETADSLRKTMEKGGISGIRDVAVEDQTIGTILCVRGSEDVNYYVYIDRGFFISRIRENSLKGRVIYRAMR